MFISDPGRQALTTHRLLGQLMIAAGLGAAHLTAFATSGIGLELKLASAEGHLASTLPRRSPTSFTDGHTQSWV